MKLTPLALELKHFEKHGSLRDAPVQPLEDPQAVLTMVEDAFQRTQSEDNEAGDYNPLPGQILQTTEGAMVRARYGIDAQGRHLERYQVNYRERNILLVRENEVGLNVFHAYSHPDSLHFLSCWSLNRNHPELNYFQEINLDPDPWLNPSGWPL